MVIKSEISIALKNALDRGQSLEKAKQSLINAGYPQQEVTKASASLNQGVIGNTIQQQENQSKFKPLNPNQQPKQIPTQQSNQQPQQSLQQTQKINKKTMFKNFGEDSLVTIQILYEITNNFYIKITFEEILKTKNI